MSASHVRRGASSRARSRKGGSRVSVPKKLAAKLPVKQAQANRLAGWAFALFALAVTGAKRLGILPDTPTMAESGLPGFESLNWNGIVGPAKMPRDVLARLHKEIVRALTLPDVKEKVTAQGNEVIGDTPEAFAKFIRAESDKWGRVVKQAGVKLQ